MKLRRKINISEVKQDKSRANLNEIKEKGFGRERKTRKLFKTSDRKNEEGGEDAASSS